MDSVMGESRLKLCRAQKKFGLAGWYCTKEEGHEGEHVATIGPYSEDATVMAKWANVPESPEKK